MNQDRLDASITLGDKNPYSFGTLENKRVKSAVLGRRGMKSSHSTRSMKSRNIAASQSFASKAMP